MSDMNSTPPATQVLVHSGLDQTHTCREGGESYTYHLQPHRCRTPRPGSDPHLPWRERGVIYLHLRPHRCRTPRPGSDPHLPGGRGESYTYNSGHTGVVHPGLDQTHTCREGERHVSQIAVRQCYFSPTPGCQIYA